MRCLKWLTEALLLLLAVNLTACAPPTPEIVTVIETVEKIVEREGEIITVVETIETIVTATPEPTVSTIDVNAPIKVMADTGRAFIIDKFLETYPEYKGKVQLMADNRSAFMTKLLLYNNIGGG